MSKIKIHSLPMLNSFLSFSSERHRVFERRQSGLAQEDWTSDEILKRYSFCNSFRVLDRGSQFFIRSILGDGPGLQTTLLRAAMYRMTNEPKFWELYEGETGHMPEFTDLEDGITAEVFQAASDRKMNMFRPAYMISFGPESKGQLKHHVAPQYFFDNFHPDGDHSIVKRFEAADTMYARVCALQEVPRIGSFLAQQIVTDINYSEHHLGGENDRVVLGPGSIRGLQYIFGVDEVPKDPHNVRGEIMIEKLQDLLREKDIQLELPGGGLRSLSLMDVQNCLCEFSKYVRHASKMNPDVLKTLRTKKIFKPTNKPLDIQLPAHWAN